MTGDERAVLAFEERYPRNDRAKEAAAREELGLSWVRYRQVLLQLVRREDVLEEYAVLAHRVERATYVSVQNRVRRRIAIGANGYPTE